jgi:Phosphotransferase enzyme family
MSLGNVVNVPETLSELASPEWLTSALGQAYPGIQVAAATIESVDTRISTNAFVRIQCAAGSPTDVPDLLCAKGYFSDTGNWAYRAAGESEAIFYRDSAAAVGVRTLPCVYADVDPETRHGVVITKDIAAEGAVFVDPSSPRSPSQVAATLEQYATMHATTWDAPWVRQAEWLAPRIASTMGTRSADEIQEQFDGPLGDGVPRPYRNAERLLEAYRALPSIAVSTPTPCLIHGDAHIANVFLDAQGRPGLLDWQLVQRGPWFVDVGYHVASSLSPEDRRTSERDLLRLYLDHLASQGVPAPAEKDVWSGFACGVVYGLFLWSITLKVKLEITKEMLARLGTAAADHDAYTSVPAQSRNWNG